MAKDVGDLATVFSGKVDVILLLVVLPITQIFTDRLKEMISFIQPAFIPVKTSSRLWQ
jgi:butyrate kinase